MTISSPIISGTKRTLVPIALEAGTVFVKATIHINERIEGNHRSTYPTSPDTMPHMHTAMHKVILHVDVYSYIMDIFPTAENSRRGVQQIEGNPLRLAPSLQCFVLFCCFAVFRRGKLSTSSYR